MHNDEFDIEEDNAGAVYIERAISAVRRRLKSIILITAIGTAAAVYYASTLPNFYEAYAFVQIDPRKKTITNFDEIFSEFRDSNKHVDGEIEVVRSKPVLLDVIDKLALRQDPEFNPFCCSSSQNLAADSSNDAPQADGSDLKAPGMPASIEELLNGRTGRGGSAERDIVVSNLASQISVTRERTTLTLRIGAYSQDPAKAARIANALAEAYLRNQISVREKTATLASDLLAKKLRVLRKDVSKAEAEVERFKAKHKIFATEQESLGNNELSRLMEQTVFARNATAAARAKYNQAKRLLDNGYDSGNLEEVLNNQTITHLKDQLAKARRRAAEYATKYGPRHPDMKKAMADVKEAQNQVDAEVAREVSNIKNEYSVAAEKEKRLLADLSALKSRQSNTNEASIELADLERNAETSRQLYEALLLRYKATAKTIDLQLPDVKIIERADIPLNPSAPRRNRIIFVGFAASLGLALLLVLGREFLTSGLTRPEDAERALEIAHLSSLPAIDDAASQAASPVHALRMILAEPNGIYAEAIRSIRRELDVCVTSPSPRVIAIASALPEEQSDLIASNLAHHYALTRNRVLLIDADLRRANLTRRLAPARPTGLLEVLWHGMPAERAILRDQNTGLDFLPAMGPSPLEPASPELLASSRMHQLMASLKQSYDVIVFDVPPLLPVIDGRILVDYADQIVFAVTWRKTPKQLAKRAIRLLGANAEKLVGAVVNQVEQGALEDSQGFAMEPAKSRPGFRKHAA